MCIRDSIQATGFGDGLAGTGGGQLLGRLRVEPGHGAAQALALRRDDAAVRGGERLAEDAGIERVDALVGQGGEAVVTLR